MSTWVLSDVHGHLDDLRERLTQAGLVDGGRWVAEEATLWVLGDLVDRGPDGIGVVRFLRSLQQQAPDHVRVLLGNHEALMLGQKLFPGSSFSDVWALNGGHQQDQDALDDDDVAWLRSLPAVGLAGDFLLMHSDTTDYLDWGDSVDAVNATVTGVLGSDDAEAQFEVFATLTRRFEYAGPQGPKHARALLDALGGSCVVHGHTIISLLLGCASSEVTAPIQYADGLAIAIDGGRYDGGPLLLLRLE